jgi:hypothetical protein
MGFSGGRLATRIHQRILLFQADYSVKIRSISGEEGRTSANASMRHVKEVRVNIDGKWILPHGGCGLMMCSSLQKTRNGVGMSPQIGNIFCCRIGFRRYYDT